MQIASDAPATFRSSADRPGPLELLVTAAREAWSRRRLIRYLVRAEIKKKGTDTILGNVWWVLDPLISLMVYVFVMSVVFARGQADFGVFLLAAMIPFKWFTGTVSDSVTAVVSQGQLIKQIQFPKIVLPIVSNGAGLVNLGVGMLVLFAIVLLWPGYAPHLSIMVLWIPVIAAITEAAMRVMTATPPGTPPAQIFNASYRSCATPDLSRIAAIIRNIGTDSSTYELTKP